MQFTLSVCALIVLTQLSAIGTSWSQPLGDRATLKFSYQHKYGMQSLPFEDNPITLFVMDTLEKWYFFGKIEATQHYHIPDFDSRYKRIGLARMGYDSLSIPIEKLRGDTVISVVFSQIWSPIIGRMCIYPDTVIIKNLQQESHPFYSIAGLPLDSGFSMVDSTWYYSRGSDYIPRHSQAKFTGAFENAELLNLLISEQELIQDGSFMELFLTGRGDGMAKSKVQLGNKHLNLTVEKYLGRSHDFRPEYWNYQSVSIWYRIEVTKCSMQDE